MYLQGFRNLVGKSQTERQGFEPWVPSRVHFLSKEALSATQPPFQRLVYYA